MFFAFIAALLFGSLAGWGIAAHILPDHCDAYSDWNWQGKRIMTERCYSLGWLTHEGTLGETR